MPLSFKSKNHGNIAFGFFNIESDMLLLENYFFFADDFCKLLDNLIKDDNETENQFRFKIYHIVNPDDIGDLMDAIHKVRYTGFIGTIYNLFPFPDDPTAFKQNPEGFQTRDIIKKEIEQFSKTSEIKIYFSKSDCVHIGSYQFDIKVFHKLIRYVEQGGYPRWKDEKRPQYVLKLKDAIKNSKNTFFKGVFAS